MLYELCIKRVGAPVHEIGLASGSGAVAVFASQQQERLALMKLKVPPCHLRCTIVSSAPNVLLLQRTLSNLDRILNITPPYLRQLPCSSTGTSSHSVASAHSHARSHTPN